MSDHSELNRLAQRVIDIEALDGGEPIGEAWGEFESAANPAAVLALIAEVEGLRAQHCRDSAELRSLSQARDDARKERDQLKAEVEALRSQVATLQSDANSWQSGYDEGRRMGTKTALDEREQLRREIASLKPYPVRTDKTTIGYTGCIICGQYTDHGGLQCPKLAARSLSMENQRIVPVETIRIEHPLDALDRKLKP